MISDLDIIRTAHVLIREHGENAGIEAGMKADRFLDEGNADGHLLWTRIVRAVEELQRTAPQGDERVH